MPTFTTTTTSDLQHLLIVFVTLKLHPQFLNNQAVLQFVN
ncbi:hypothetical protein A2U01_0071983, partial [Trifolium medium]|nr:hypothetical protein [Trifolium medium]